MTLSLPDLAQGWGHWLLRLPVAATFGYHGVTKFPILTELEATFGQPIIFWLTVALVEVFAALGLLAGGLFRGPLPTLSDLATRGGGLAAIAIMIGAIATVHWVQWSVVPSETHPTGGMEFQVLLLSIGAYFALLGNRG